MKARLPQGYGGGGGGNMQGMLKQAQKMQEQMQEKQAELDERDYTAVSGGGMVECTVNGRHELKALHIKPDVIDPDDSEMLEDLVMAAVNEAIRTAAAAAEEELGAISGGLQIPGMF